MTGLRQRSAAGATATRSAAATAPWIARAPAVGKGAKPLLRIKALIVAAYSSGHIFRSELNRLISADAELVC